MNSQDKAKQQAEVMLAYANGAEIEFTDVSTSWTVCFTEPTWDWRLTTYRVKKPAPKVVKLSAYITENGQMIYYDSLKVKTWDVNWKRVPSLDLEYTEDES